MEVTEQAPRIVRGRTEMIVPYGDSEIAHVSPAVGPGNYQNAGKQILKQGFSVPHGDYTASLVHAAYCSKAKAEPEFANVRDIARKRWLWVFNRNLWTPQGLYVQQDEKAIGRNKPITVNELEEMLKGGKELSKGGIRFSADNKVRFAPKESYVLGEHAAKSLANDGFMIAQYGQKGAELLAEASATLPNNPKTHGLEITEGQNPELRVSALGEGVGGLLFGGCDFDGNGGGCAFSVSAPNAKKLE